MFAIILSSAVVGIDGVLIRVEVDVSPGLPAFNIVGLPDASVRESKQRVTSAIKNSGYKVPATKITVNLAPANIRKEGAVYDLSIALGILAATDQIPVERLLTHVVMGELSLSGKVRKIKGVLPSLLMAKDKKLVGALIPEKNYRESKIVKNVRILKVNTLKDAIEFCHGIIQSEINESTIDESIYSSYDDLDYPDFCEVKGQECAKRALEIAAAGGHNILMIGPPGSGKTMLAKRLPSILPEMNINESLETTKIHSVAGILRFHSDIVRARPFRAPHHTISDVALVGGGTYPRPGEISLSHNGVLFLDELPEFRRNVLEVLRQPLEEKKIVISRAAQTLSYPAKIMFVSAMNPCPCGYYGSSYRECRCTPFQISKYINKISGPMWDRIDLHIEVSEIAYQDLSTKTKGEASKTIRNRVINAREIQRLRYQHIGISTNAEMGVKEIESFCALDKQGSNILEKAMNKFNFSARAYARILKVARSIADLDNSENIKPEYLTEAIQYRSLDKNSSI